MTVRVVATVLAYLAEIVMLIDVPTGLVVIGKFAVVLPAGTKTELGTITTDGVPEVRSTLVPPVPAGELKVTVPCDEFPPDTVAGFATRPATPIMLTVTPPEGVSRFALSSTARLRTVKVPPVLATQV